MKRIIIVLILSFSLFSVFAEEKIKVCVYPENKEISSYVNNYFDSKAVSVSSSLKVDDSDLETGDNQLMHLICDLSKSDFLLIPLKSELSDFHHLRLFAYNPKTEKFTKLHESLSRDSFEYGIEIIYEIANLILDEDELSSFEIKQVDYDKIKIEIPDDYDSDSKPQWMKDKSLYEDKRNAFYYSFAETLAVFGVKAAARSLNSDTFDCICTGALCISLTNLVRTLFDYCRSASYISP